MAENWQASPRVLALHLIDCGSRYDVDTLDRIYAPSQYLLMVAADGSVEKIDRAQNMRLFRNMRDDGAPPLSPEADILHIEQDDADGVVLIRRRMDPSGPSRLFELRMRKTGAVWQVIGETVTPWIGPEPD